jgi:zinc transporter ZupT
MSGIAFGFAFSENLKVVGVIAFVVFLAMWLHNVVYIHEQK